MEYAQMVGMVLLLGLMAYAWDWISGDCSSNWLTLQNQWGRIGFDSICHGWCKHAVRWIISTLI